MADKSLIDVAAAVADGLAIDWTSATRTLGTADERQLLDGLKLIADVTSARGVALSPPPDTTPLASEPRGSDAEGS